MRAARVAAVVAAARWSSLRSRWQAQLQPREMVAAMVEAIEWAKVGWVKDEADRARAEEMVAAVVEAMKARMSGGRRRNW